MALLQPIDGFPMNPVRGCEGTQHASTSNGMKGNVPSVTVQTVLLHPSLEGVVYWVLNEEETGCAKESGILSTRKPRGWGNPGGGVEAADQVNERGMPRSFEQTTISCGRRELMGETGFINFEFEPYLPSRIQFLEYTYPCGHTVLTLLGRLHNFQSIPADEVETKEIINGSWFDLSISPVDLFQDKPDLPYWSHVRRTMMIFDLMASRTGDDSVMRNLHPLWRLVSPIATKDKRFPKNGYLIPPVQWYKVMQMFIECRVRTVNLDLIYEYLHSHIEEERRREEKTNPRMQYRSNREQWQSWPPDDENLAVQYKEKITQYEEDYRIWAEEIRTA